MTAKWQASWGIALGCAMAASGAAGMAQTSSLPDKDDLFAGTEKFAQGASSVTQIDMDPDSLGKVEGKDGLRARRMVLSVVHTYEYDKPGMYRIEDVEAFRKKLETGEWHCSVHIREMKTGESTDVCNKRREDGLNEQAVITVEPKALTFIHTIGNGRFTLPLGMQMIRPEMQVEVAVMRIEMQAQMAGVRPEMQRQFEVLKNFKGPDPEQIRRLQDALKGLGEEKMSGDAGKAP